MYLLAPWCCIMYILSGWQKIIILLKLTPKMSFLWVQTTHEQFKMRFVPGYFSSGLNSKGLNNFWWWYDAHEIVLLDASAWWIIVRCLPMSSDHSTKLLCPVVFIASLWKDEWILNLWLPLLTPRFMLHCLDDFTICLCN